MSPRPPRFEWVPPLLVGASAAVAAEVAVSLLLYGGPGLVRSLTTVLGVESVAFAAGLWSAPAAGRELVDRIRRWWVFGLLAFVVAATYASAWTFLPVLAEGRGAHAAGLVILGALPLYACGAVLGGMSVAASTDRGGRLSLPGASAAAGAGVGFVLTGLFLPRVPMPGTMLVGCLILLSIAGMAYGMVLGARTSVTTEARRPTPNGEVRVQERHVEGAGVAVLELIEGAAVRRVDELSATDSTPAWDASVIRALLPQDTVGCRILVVGGGASSVPRTVLHEHPLAQIDVAERTAAVVELGREYFATELSVGTGDRHAVAIGNLDDLVAMLQTTYDIVLVDLRALEPIGGFRGLSRAGRWRLFDAVAPGGTVVIGPHPVDPLPDELKGWVETSFIRDLDATHVSVLSPGTMPDGLEARLDGFRTV